MDFFFFKLSSDMKTLNSHFYILDTIVKVGRVKFSISASCFASQYTCWLQHSYSDSIFFFIFLADLSAQPGLCCGTASKDSSEKVSNAFIRPSCFFRGSFTWFWVMKEFRCVRIPAQVTTSYNTNALIKGSLTPTPAQGPYNSIAG